MGSEEEVGREALCTVIEQDRTGSIIDVQVI